MLHDKCILLNLSNQRAGGGVQVADSFLYELIKLGVSKQFHLALSADIVVECGKVIYDQFASCHILGRSNFWFDILKNTRKLRVLEKKIKPDLVFTLFGPAYWRPKAFHLLGFAQPWVIYKKNFAYQKLSFINKINYWLRYQVLFEYLFKREGDYFIAETGLVKQKMIQTLGITPSKISVVENTVNPNFYLPAQWQPLKPPLIIPDHDIFLLSIGAPYVHKNFEIIAEVGAILEKKGIKSLFMVTMPEAHFEQMAESFKRYCVNAGVVSSKQVPLLYQQTDGLFLPTLLECFSASYIEAMASHKPIVTTDLDFAREVCGDAAIYFKPLDANDAAQKIAMLLDQDFFSLYLQKQDKRCSAIVSSEERARRYLSIIEQSC